MTYVIHVKSCFLFEPSNLDVKIKFKIVGYPLFLKNLPYHCEVCNKMFILTADFKIDKTEDKT